MVVAVRCLLVLSSAIPLVAETLDPVNDLRLGVTFQQSPRLYEEITPPGGAGKTYGWDGAKTWGLRYDIEYDQKVSGPSHATGGFLWTVGASYADTDITPRSYDTGSGSSTNTRDDLKLSYRQYGLLAGAGWATAPHVSGLGDYHWELSAIGRGGLSSAETTSPGIRTGIEKGRGWYGEGGLRGVFVLCDNDWLMAITAGWLYGRNSITIDLPDGSVSKLMIVRNGGEVGLHIGVRF